MIKNHITTYIVGGTPRSGKTSIKHIFLDRYKIPGITTDLLRDAFEKEVPSFGIKDGQKDLEKAEILWPYFKGILDERKNYSDKLLIEGVNFLPKHLNNFKNIGYIQMCFMGFAEINPMKKLEIIRNNPSNYFDWTSDVSDEEILGLIDRWIKDSKYFRDECKKYSIKYFDTSKDFKNVIEQAVNYLINND